ncbi:hypothetical protein BCR32DRAFT_306256 [Anaeromyces robustus]|uniref:Methyltransferase domain-containing protein n=1 Tax=Anaeromyces robustus TaxID=1754192 RepID=A0A1Y1VV50_9FUNG|nr:hypothetical protein BCR32DRAFT_306256 [Anaeromyces robustus]|eukprot:ORX65169.1 hypothetical protein BCR32DRAFT_306256 [Anaeromyces robustus]
MVIEIDILKNILTNIFTDISIINVDNIELEFRLKKHYRNKELIKNFINKHKQHFTIYEYSDFIVKEKNIIYRKRNNKIINKELVNFINIIPFKIVLSIEHDIDNFPNNNNIQEFKHIRYSLFRDYYRIDITDDKQFEIEILNFDINLIDKIIDSIIDILNYFDVIDINTYLNNFNFQKPITPFIDDLLEINKGFYITNKIDGIRKLLIITSNALYSYDNIMTKISNCNSNDIIICDCEFYNNSYYCFDIIYFNKDLRKYKYKKRIEYFSKLPEFLVDNILIKKNIQLIYNVKDILNYIKKNNNLILIDGFILTYKNSNYFDNLVYKIKYSYKNTIDVFIKNGQCYQQDIDGLSLIPNIIYDKKYNNKLIEVLLKSVNNKYYGISIKERSDKVKPNFKYTINSIISAINYGLDTNIFTNNSSLLLRRCHNFFKQKILSNCINEIENPTLIDIGSGNGADIGKWIGFKKITIIEKNKDKINIINNRLRNNYNYLSNKIKILNIDFLNYDDISTNYITSFFMLNDIKDKNILNNFIKIMCNKSLNKCFIIFLDYDKITSNIYTKGIKLIKYNEYTETTIYNKQFIKYIDYHISGTYLINLLISLNKQPVIKPLDNFDILLPTQKLYNSYFSLLIF